jgi:hypothetical protein
MKQGNIFTSLPIRKINWYALDRDIYMAVIQNKWVQKQLKKRAAETAPAFESVPDDDWLPVNTKKPIERHTNASRATMHKTLRGVRK